MKAKISYVLYKIHTGFWFLPTLITLLAVALSQFALMGDQHVSAEWARGLTGVARIGPEGARLLMATIAGSMMTVTSLVFSLTLVALTMTSSQFGPRLLTNFMRDRVTQFVLGAFLATFVYALITLSSIEKANAAEIVPYISVTTAMALALGSFGVLIYFIHHIASSIQADSIIARMAAELKAGIEAHFPEQDAEGDVEPALAQAADAGHDEIGCAVACNPPGGYVQSIDYDALAGLAAENEAIIVMRRRAGHFVVPGELLAQIRPAAAANEEMLAAVARAVVIGQTQTMVQDPEYSVKAITEVALRALSPGVNDTHTALSCVDYIGAGLACALRRGEPARALRDENGDVRVLVDPVTFEGIADSAYNEIRQTAQDNVAVIVRLLESLIRLAPFADRNARRQVIEKHARMIERACRDTIKEQNDRADIERRFAQLSAALNRRP